MTIILFFVFFSFPKSGDAQTNKFEIVRLDSVKYPHYFINIGAGLVNGGRADFIFKFHRSISAEVSYGYDVRNFITNSDVESRFTLGLNWHSQKSIPWITSLLITYAKSSSDSRIEDPRYLISFNMGYLEMNKPGFRFIARAGLYIEYYKYLSKEIKFGGFYPNAEVGIGWVF